jgi:hypothetical protein
MGSPIVEEKRPRPCFEAVAVLSNQLHCAGIYLQYCRSWRRRKISRLARFCSR